ncbi:BirA family biotin operon repressor/biotin-[acetyl-CoA-carboxylase] ligase [Halorubrum alkaliphilum]|uniref:BirA family biotin operon repressor/biotin-[acetyl-CoA-carboxylase] ligase n=1 Tax=Halorubrum alkaliphilum TaxID=261290 RepID=A0A8T4GBP7_9EURY|nr:biotin--[acetyl-CoA-carboxylase] ligase [Halorubrum alkaliphilum]MBP1921159.1 BirA family biotin operon repressor/biotin-[acetyl-CoA-carboxylase] ligase [Halorubrum alkaliphilum]
MDTRRALLEALGSGPVSGPALADDLGVSRAAVWKAVESLREEGFAVESTSDGYVAPEDPAYCAAGIEFGLDAPYAVEYHDAVGSTNDRARTLAEEGRSDVVVVADEQTGSRGRLDREWVAPSGGVWVSVLIRPDVAPARAPVFTLAAAVAMTDACREAGVDAGIKWPNDVLVRDAGDAGTDGSVSGRGGRKLAGILTEMEGEADRVSWLVLGIGINANIDADALPVGATSLRVERAGPGNTTEGTATADIDRRRFVARLLERFAELAADPDAILPAWREHAITLGRRVRVETSSGEVIGTAVDIEPPGALAVETDDGRVRVHAGDCEHLRDADSPGADSD